MSKRTGFLVAAAALFLVVCLLGVELRLTQEPTYKGLTMHQALGSTSPQAQEALLALGTNNLPLLIKRVSYDPRKAISARLLVRVARLTHSPAFYDMATRRTLVADEAHSVFYRLGPKAAPAIPQLASLLEQGGKMPSDRAMSILVNLGDEGIALVVPRTTHTNSETRCRAVMLLMHHPESAAARSALTNALHDSDPTVRRAAAHAFDQDPGVQEPAWRSITNSLR